jgi:hypothetical protein
MVVDKSPLHSLTPASQFSMRVMALTGVNQGRHTLASVIIPS